ncbi:hypothetical protein [Streptomyces gibsoniae]|uniref:Uncharacterized protein n=1 Tax=Streptomyces gibsoniae TaxID=3075529 RepID=A0ABU2TNT4_9ACTN|nr:hypothetical protein [Streptomyces sp. DSM 41699]MDT0462605.1 hypothetical protein [Streptomyces sp. DSM 41699]
MNYVRGFAPWLCYAALSPFDWRLGMGAAALAALLLLAGQLRARSVDLLGAATCAFFVVMAGVAVADPASGLQHWTCALANGTLAVVAAASLAVRRPFTLSIARTQVPREFWNAPRFIRVNMVLTTIWAAGFTTAAIVCALVVEYDHAAAVPLITAQVLGFVVPFALSSRYAGRAQARAAAGRATS